MALADYIVNKPTKVIGDLWVYLIENDRMASVAIRLAPVRQGMGFGTEALSAMTRFCFANTELKRLWAEVDVRNIPSQRMLEKCGYQREGLIRQGKMVSTWCDYYIYGVLACDLKRSSSSTSAIRPRTSPRTSSATATKGCSSSGGK